MKKLFLILSLFFLNSCAETIALLGPASSAFSGGNIINSSLQSAASYGIKRQTGKTPLGHALTYTTKMNPEKKQETCISFIEKTNSELCAVLKKKMGQTRAKIINSQKNEKSLKELSLSSQFSINKKSKIKYLD